MIPFATQRGSGQDLATHLQNTHDNEIMEVAEVRGAIAQDLHGAFAEWEAQAHALTRCKKYLYSMSINPDPNQEQMSREQYYDYIARTEEKLGLEDQPRAIVFHSKYGREHCHVVWSRIDQDEEKAVHLAFDKEKLMMVTREFAREHEMTLPKGYERSDKTIADNQRSLYEQYQDRSTGLSKEDHIEQVTDAWRQSDSAKAFVHALADRGYILATGKRPYVVVDIYGNMNSLPKLIDDKDVRTKDIAKFLGSEFSPESLPSVDEIKQLVKKHLKILEQHSKAEQRQEALEQLKSKHELRRNKLVQDKADLKKKQHQDQRQLAKIQLLMRTRHRIAYMDKSKQIKLERYHARTKGMAKFLGQVTGVELVRKKLRKYQDKKRLQEFRQEKDALKHTQAKQSFEMAYRHDIQQMDMNRKIRVQERIERKELRSLEEELKRDMRINTRSDGYIKANSIALDVVADKIKDKPEHLSLVGDFERAVKGKTKGDKIDLKKDFTNAATDSDQTDGGDEGATDAPKLALQTPKKTRTRRKRRKRNRGKGLDRER